MKNSQKTIIGIAGILVIAVLIFLFTFQTNQSRINGNLEQQTITKQNLKLGLITGLGGLGDKSFNDMQYRGMIMARREYGIEFEYLTPGKEEDDYLLMQQLIEKKCNVIIGGGGYHNIEPIEILSEKYPEILFVLLDDFARTYRKNVASVSFRQNEGSFLAGALAALVSDSKKIGVVAAMDIKVINDFIIGYEEGAHYIHNSFTIYKSYISTGSDGISPWNKPEMAYEKAVDLYDNKGVDVIFAVASASGMGVFRAAQKKEKFAIGVDSDQDYLAEGYILSSMMKNLDVGILFIVEKILKNEFENKAYILGLKENGIGLSPMTFTRNVVSDQMLEKLDVIKSKILKGELKVKSVYDK